MCVCVTIPILGVTLVFKKYLKLPYFYRSSFHELNWFIILIFNEVKKKKNFFKDQPNNLKIQTIQIHNKRTK